MLCGTTKIKPPARRRMVATSFCRFFIRHGRALLFGAGASACACVLFSALWSILSPFPAGTSDSYSEEQAAFHGPTLEAGDSPPTAVPQGQLWVIDVGFSPERGAWLQPRRERGGCEPRKYVAREAREYSGGEPELAWRLEMCAIESGVQPQVSEEFWYALDGSGLAPDAKVLALPLPADESAGRPRTAFVTVTGYCLENGFCTAIVQKGESPFPDRLSAAMRGERGAVEYFWAQQLPEETVLAQEADEAAPVVDEAVPAQTRAPAEAPEGALQWRFVRD